MSEVDHSSEPRGDDVLVPEFVLGLLDRAEHEAFARRLASEPGLRAAVREWQLRFEGLDSGFDDAAPPAAAWTGIERRLFGTQAKSAGWWNSLAVWRGFTAAALAVAVIAIGVNLFRPAPLDPQQFAVELVAALQAQEGSGIEFVAFYDSASGMVKLMGLTGEPLPDRDFELWYIKGEEAPVSMGVVPPGQRMEIALDATARGKFAEGTVLAVSLEPKGGSTTGAPTGPVVAAGKALAI
jgi:anti-sigma-K factor RskA